MNKVSVVIVTYNGIHWIKECIESLLQSTLKVSIIIVDNCSSDTTVSFIKKHYDNEVCIIKLEENLGFGRGNNVGIKIALKSDPDYIFLLNQDAFVEINTIEKLVDVANKNSDYGIISPIHTDWTGTVLDNSFLYYISNRFGRKFISDFVLNKTKQPIYQVPMVNAAAWLLPKTTIDSVGGFDPIFFLYGEDDNYCQRVSYHNLKIGIVNDTFIRHDSDNNNSKEIKVGSDKYFEIFLNRIKIKHGNVNTDEYKKLGVLRFYFLKRMLISLISLNILDYKVNLRKWQLIQNLELRNSVFINRQKGRNYL